MGIALALIALVAWVLLRATQRPSKLKGPVELLARVPLEPRRTLYLVALGERCLLLGASEAGLSTLAEMAREDLEVGAPASGPSFQQRLQRAAAAEGEDEP